MLFWIILALMCVVAALSVMLPLMRNRRAGAGTDARDDRTDNRYDVAVYRDQLAELDRDRERGLIGGAEAEAARAEIARRLIAAGSAGAAAAAPRSWRGPVALLTAVAVPGLGLAFYLTFGSPDLPDQPLVARLATPAAPTDDISVMIGRVEKHLEQNPRDAEGWRVIAPVYMRIGRYDAAADALRRVVALGEATEDDREAYGEALVAANDGIVGKEAQDIMAEVLDKDPERPKARFYFAEGLRQSGDLAGALRELDDLIGRSPENAPWLPGVRDKRKSVLTALGRPADTPAPASRPAIAAFEPQPAPQPGPTAGDVAAAGSMSETDRSAMIAGMVQQLADRLAGNPKDSEGWQRLMRAYVVLNRNDDAKAAYDKARAAFADDAATLATIDAAAQELGLKG